MKCDVAIVGAGPAGGMAACLLAGSGLRVVLLEKCPLPRPKACGGAVPEDALRGLNGDWQTVVERRVWEIRYLCDFQMERTFRASTPLLMVDRSRFDEALIRRAAAAGKGDFTVRDRFAVKAVEEAEHAVRIRGECGKTVTAGAVIAADGANSRIGRQLGLGRPRAEVLALDATVALPGALFDRIKTTAVFNMSCLPTGYGWIFPKDGYLSCGAGAFGTGKGLSAAFDRFIRKSFPGRRLRIIEKRVHPVPIFTGRAPLSTRRVCLAGDAASLVDPVMGEGIRYALQSGAMAATSVLRLLGGGQTPDPSRTGGVRKGSGLLPYGEAVDAEIGSRLEPIYRFALPLFQKRPDFFYRKFFYEGFSYRDVCRGLARKMALAQEPGKNRP